MTIVVVLFSIRKISKDDRALISVLRQEKNWSSQRLLRKFSGKNWAWTSADRLLVKINVTDVTERPTAVTVCDQFARRNFGKKIELVDKLICSHKSALRSTKIRTKLEGRWTFHGRLFGVLQSMIRLKI